MPVKTPWPSHNQSPFLRDGEKKTSEEIGEKVEMRTQVLKSVCSLVHFEQDYGERYTCNDSRDKNK